jgi:PcRGLX-like protein C-terminal alpha/alpha toroid domain/PcRGLX-like protein central beta sandwich domain/PcRGLX-like N-terminal RIFT barrel domain
MSDHSFSRRDFIVGGLSGSAAASLAPALADDAHGATANTAAGTATAGAATASEAAAPISLTNPAPGAWARWLDGRAPTINPGATWGMPWPQGQHKHATTHFALREAHGGTLIPLQSWPLAFWPDGSLKWTAHALPVNANAGAGPWEIGPTTDKLTTPDNPVSVKEDATAINIDTGAIICRINKTGRTVIDSITRNGHISLREGHLVLLSQDQAAPSPETTVHHQAFESRIDRVVIEQQGPVRAVIKIEGSHQGSTGRRWLPFILRLYFYAQSDSVRVIHTIVFDGDESRDFIRGIGLRFLTPLAPEIPQHNRHVRFCGEASGLFCEAVRGLTGLRRDPGARARQEQLDGVDVTSIAADVQPLLQFVPTFGDWTLLQATADSFHIRKRTQDGHAWLDADRGRRASGLGFVGTPQGGVAFGINNFWQSHPAQLDVRGAAGTTAEVTLWVWAPESPPMDLRFYHDGMGQDSYAKQEQGLQITYEDYEPGFGTPVGVARTSEMRLWILPATPTRENLTQLAAVLTTPPVIVPTPQTLQDSGVFARSFARSQNATPASLQIERQLDWLFDFYHQQRDARSWYGFWNYGDVMHTYDADRHVWRYDVGGFAWDNSELSTDIWLWLYFLRTGRPDVFRFAEAMTRHTGEVDVHHLGRFAPLGSRHNVMHWGCSAKQLRISTASNRRYYYYLTADERVGDLMRAQVEAARTLRTIQPGRKLPDAHPLPDPNGDRAWLGFGTDWGAIAGAWLTEWERTGDLKMRSRLHESMRTIAAQPRGFLTGGGWLNLITGAFDIASTDKISVSHLSAAFGLPEVCAELVELLSVPEFEQSWLQYCELFNAPPEEQKRVLGQILAPLNLEQGHARLTAFAAQRRRNPALGARAWQEFEAGKGGIRRGACFQSQRIQTPAVLNPVDEVAWLSTNSAAQWALAAIECLAFAGEALSTIGDPDAHCAP